MYATDWRPDRSMSRTGCTKSTAPGPSQTNSCTGRRESTGFTRLLVANIHLMQDDASAIQTGT
jgi:hypothetical protein